VILAGTSISQYAQPQYAHRHHKHYFHEAHKSSLLSSMTVALRTLRTDLAVLGGGPPTRDHVVNSAVVGP
jgi:hypothetical protein